jgi:outer membrane receptor protein involved in Fe transport
MNKSLQLIFLLIITIFSFTFAGTTGKLSGRVTETETGEPLIGVNVIIEGTSFGAATDLDGRYIINNIPPGTYSVVFSAVGFEKKQVNNVRVSVDFTTNLDLTLSSRSIELQTVIVEAKAPLVRKDLTSSHVTVDASQIEALPVESISQLLRLQAGVVQGAGGELHIRGGRSTEIAYTVNGVSINNPFDNSRTVSIATNAIQELSVVSGTFNAEYGNALSGIVNTVTKEGGRTIKGKFSAYSGDYLSGRDEVFFNIGKVDPLNNSVVEATFGGPIPLLQNRDMLSFFFSGRFSENNGYLYGIRQHLPADSASRDPQTQEINIAATGDNAIIPMNVSRDRSGTGKLTFKPIPTLKINYDLLYSDSRYKTYNHDYKYNPEARPINYDYGILNSLEIRHALSNNTFYTLRGSYNFNDYKQYLYALVDEAGNPVDFYPGKDMTGLRPDPRYQPDYKSERIAAYTFLSGGTSNYHYYQRSKTLGGKFDITSQLNNNHEIKAGLQVEMHRLDFQDFLILRDASTYLEPTILPETSRRHDYYSREPFVFATYFQDKMEFESMVVNIGLRYDYYDAKASYATDILNPPNYKNNPVDEYTAQASAKHQLSPRFGISFPITDRGIIHFSYGHFFQMPPFNYLYTNPNFEFFEATSPTLGNANLNPEKTVTYELGLQQQLTEDLAFNVTGFYKDVRDLLALQQIRISGSDTYYKYVNKDYGNIKGITFSLTKRRTPQNMLSVTVDYTFQTAEGNESNSDAFFLDLSSGRQSEKIPVFLNWDQTHTLNTSVSIGESRNWNVSVISRMGTGLPYTPQISGSQIYLRTNSGRRPAQLIVDLLAEKSFAFIGLDLTLFIKVFNLFDTLNERLIYTDTGRATYTLTASQAVALSANELSEKYPLIHPSSEYFVRPHYYLPPRQVRFGFSVEF